MFVLKLALNLSEINELSAHPHKMLIHKRINKNARFHESNLCHTQMQKVPRNFFRMYTPVLVKCIHHLNCSLNAKVSFKFATTGIKGFKGS